MDIPHREDVPLGRGVGGIFLWGIVQITFHWPSGPRARISETGSAIDTRIKGRAEKRVLRLRPRYDAWVGATTTWCRWSSIFVLACLGACAVPGYRLQAVRGQLDLLERRRPLSTLMQDPKTPPKLRAWLIEVGRIKEYALTQGLRANSIYRHYAQLDREAAVWVVTASAPLKFEAKTWRFLFGGSFSYLGWFDRDDAHAFARKLEEEGLDVHVRGASAYSTLGWFDDPILSTMIAPGPSRYGRLANTVLHESLHATLHFCSSDALQ